MKSLSRVRLLATPWTAAYQARVREWGAIAFSAPLAGGLANRGSCAGVEVGGTWHRVGLGPSRGRGVGWGPEARGQL